MSTVSVTNIKNAAFASNNLVLDASGNTTAAGTIAMGSSYLRNRIINGDMRIDQRNAGAAQNNVAAVTTYCVDRFAYYGTTGSKFSIGQNVGSVTPPVGFTNYLGVSSLAATTPASTDLYLLTQKIEGFNVADLGWGAAGAQTVTLSFWVRSSATGTFGGSLFNSAATRNYVFSYTISSANTWEQKSVVIPGDTTGTWLTTNGTGVSLWFNFASGSSNLGTAGSWGATGFYGPTGAVNVLANNGATFYITGVQLEVGSVATPFERRQYGHELFLASRYYERSDTTTPGNIWSGYAVSGNNYFSTHYFKVQKRTTPTMTYTDGGGGGFPSGAPTGYNPSTTEAVCYKAANATSNSGYFQYIWSASAEL